MTDPNEVKVAVCEYLLAVNRDFQKPPGRHPLIPPTAINWLGDGITRAVIEALQSADDATVADPSDTAEQEVQS